MKRADLLTATIALALFAATAGQICRGGPPVATDSGKSANRLTSPADDVGLPPIRLPHIGEYFNSGCLERLDGDPEWPCGEDEIALTAEGNTLHVAHLNATYNCCPDDIAVCLSVEGNLLMLTELEILTMPCDCWCCYDVEATVVDLAPGTYTVEYCWYDYETDEEQCYVEVIEIAGDAGPPPDRGDPPRGDPPVRTEGADVADVGSSPQTCPIDSSPMASPRVETCVNSGCLDDPNDPWWPPCGDDGIQLTVAGSTLHVLHENALYNCCPDDIVISLSIEGNLLVLTEEEDLTSGGCYCVCCYNVEATIVDLAPGTYTVQFCWFDYDTDQIECYFEDVVIP